MRKRNKNYNFAVGNQNGSNCVLDALDTAVVFNMIFVMVSGITIQEYVMSHNNEPISMMTVREQERVAKKKTP